MLHPKGYAALHSISTLIDGSSPSLPMLFGDLLISIQGEGDKGFTIPGVGSRDKIEFSEGSIYTPTDFKQKVCLLNDSLAVAWAGTQYKAFNVIRGLSTLQAPITIELIKNYLANIPNEEDVSFIVLAIDKPAKRQFICKHGPVKQWETRSFGGVYASGTGLDHLKNSTDLMEKLNFVSNKSSNHMTEMISKVSFLSSMLLVQGFNIKDFKTKKFPSFNTIRNYFGGGYEIAYPRGGGLCKLENICYVFWVTECVSEKEIRVIQEWKIFYYTYQGDVLFLRAIHIRPTIGSNFDFNYEENTTYVIQPVHKYYPNDDLVELCKKDFEREFSPEIIVHYVMVFKNSNGSRIPLDVGALTEFIDPNEKLSFNLIKNSVVEVTPKLTKEIASLAQEIYCSRNSPNH